MIVVDTNVLSEMMRHVPDPTVLSWAESAGPLYTTAITVAEIDYGIARLAAGRRKDRLSGAATQLFADFAAQIVPFDDLAARQYGRIVAERERAGRPISVSDAQIAAICASRHASLVTRNVEDFTDTGIDLVNPWIA